MPERITTHKSLLTYDAGAGEEFREHQPFSGTCLSGGLVRHALLDRLL